MSVELTRAQNRAKRQAFLPAVKRFGLVAFNQVTRSMGEPDFYPFVLSLPAVRKLHFIHRVVRVQQVRN